MEITTVVKVENLVKRYGSNYALNDVSFEIGEGEIVGLLGPNGAGKSTTMNILTGYLSSTSGAAYINGINILEDPIGAKKFIGFLPEQPPLYPEMTVSEFLDFVYELKSCELPRKEHLAEILDVVKLTDVKDRLIRNLSKGYKQRVGIASALVGDPKIIIFDEPTVGLDPKQIIEVRNLIRTLGKKHTVILSTHILAEVQAVCERVIIINKGKIIADEKTANIVKTIEGGYSLSVKIAGPEREVEQALAAAEILASEGIDASVVNMACIKPIDRDLVIAEARACGAIVTAEEHSIIGGLGSAVAEVVCEECPVPVIRVGVKDTFGKSGPAAALVKEFGLDAESIADAARRAVKLK